MKHIGVLESNLSGSGFDGMRVAKELGLRVTFFSSGLDRYLAVPGGARSLDDHVDDIVMCDTREFDAVMERVREIQATRPFSAFLSMAEYEVVVAARVARELGLPGPAPGAVATARNKVRMRQRCAARGVPMPAFRAVDNADAAVRAAREVGLPCIVKPADETSSADVRRCRILDDVAEQFALIAGKPLNIRGQPRHPQVLVEECATGFEVSVEVLACGPRYHVLGVTDKTVGGHDRFVELRHVFPSLLPDDVRRQAEDVAVGALRAVGFDLGLAHVEVRFTAAGPKLIEANPRPAGGRITQLVDESLGTSCLEPVLRQYLGEHVERMPARPSRGAAVRYLTADPGVVTSVSGIGIATAMPGVREAVVSVRPGDEVGSLLRNEDRVGHVLTVADDPYVAARIADAAAHEIAVLTDRRASPAAASRGERRPAR